MIQSNTRESDTVVYNKITKGDLSVIEDLKQEPSLFNLTIPVDTLTEFNKSLNINNLFPHGIYEEDEATKEVYFKVNAFSFACALNKIELANELLKLDFVNKHITHDNKPLKIATACGLLPIVERLLAKDENGHYEFPAIIDNIATDNNIILWLAVENGHLPIVERLLAKKEDGCYEFQAIVDSITIGNFKSESYTIMRDDEFISEKRVVEYDINKILCSAVKCGHFSILERLLTKKDNGDYEFPSIIAKIAVNYNEPLLLAAQNGHLAIVERLLAKTIDGHYEFPEIIRKIAINSNQILQEAAKNGHLAIVERLLAKTIDGYYEFQNVIDIIAASNNRVLCRAIENGHLPIVERLLARKDDNHYEFQAIVDKIAANGNFPLRHAAISGHIAIFERLLKRKDNNCYEFPAIIENLAADNHQLLIISIANGRLAVVERLLAKQNGQYEFQTIIDKITAKKNEIFATAAGGGHLPIVECLLAKDDKACYEFQAVVDNIASNNNEAFRFAARANHLPVVERLLAKDKEGHYEFQAIVDNLAAEKNEALRFAVERGHLLVVERLLAKTSNGRYEFPVVVDNIAANNNEILRKALENKNLSLAEQILTRTDKGHYEFQAAIDNIAVNNNAILLLAIRYNYLPLIERLLSKTHDGKYEFPKVIENLAVDNNKALVLAVENNNLSLINRLLGKNERGQYEFQNVIDNITAIQSDSIFFSDIRLLCAAAKNGNLLIIERLLAKTQDGQYEFQKLVDDISAFDNTILCTAIEENHLPVIERLLAKTPDGQHEFQKIVDSMATKNNVLFTAIKNDCLPVVERLLAKTQDGQYEFPEVINNIASERNEALYLATEHGHLPTVERLLARNEDGLYEFQSIVDNITIDDNAIFCIAVKNDHTDLVNRFLSFSAVFSYAEMHVREYGHYVKPFIENYLKTLDERRLAFELEYPNNVFNVVDVNESALCFYILRNLIREVNEAEAHLVKINFLLSLPSVHDRAADNDNELLRLAYVSNNVLASQRLLSIHEVRRLAERHNFYQGERRGELDLRRLAQDAESSMIALSKAELEILENAKTRYHHQLVEHGGIEVVFNQLKTYLQKKYEENPALLEKEGNVISLPFSWEQLQKLKQANAWSESDFQEVLKMYYQNTYHIAHRYLSKPNDWISPDARYVCVIEDSNKRYANFEEYIPLIALFWFAAQDESEPAREEGFTPENRKELFVKQVALIGRAHNWDKIRNNPATGASEEYDDLEGDKPSCYSGVNRRLFQSVLGHSLFKKLTPDIFHLELRSFVRSFYQDYLKSLDKGTLIELYTALREDNPEGYFLTLDASKFQMINVTNEEKSAFLDSLVEKYGPQNASFIEILLNQAFDTKGYNGSDFIKFYTSFSLKEMLQNVYNQCAGLSTESISFFGTGHSRTESNSKEIKKFNP